MLTITDEEFKKLASFIKENYGIHLKEEKKTLILARLNGVLASKNMQNFTQYYDYIISDKSGQAVTELINKITTNHTFFMREADHFYFLRDKVLPQITKKIKDKDLRIWCSASSTGEEAYTLAMVIDEFFGKEKILWDTKILATDISERVLEIAKAGIYTAEQIEPLPAKWKLNYLKQIDEENFQIVDKIRNEVIFRKFNLMEKVYPFRRKFHVIFCRNVMIYFDAPTRSELVKKFYDILEPGGFLFIGHSESITREESKFKYLMPSVYMKE